MTVKTGWRVLGGYISLAYAFLLSAAAFTSSAADSRRLWLIDSVTPPSELAPKRFMQRPGDVRYESSVGFNATVLDLFDSPLLAVDWQDVDPRIFPRHSPGRRWVDRKAEEIDRQCAGAHAAGLKILAQCDFVILPKELVRRYKLETTLGEATSTQIASFLRLNIQQAMRRFPLIDGYIIRIGETYVHNAPYHQGQLNKPHDLDRTILPIVQLMKTEVCLKENRYLIVRSWLSFDEPDNFQKVDSSIAPNDKLLFSIKHCEGDFHRGNPFSRIIGNGRNRQIIEIQCAREYEGKGAYPNYIANGVIEGFEEDASRTPRGVPVASLKTFAGESTLFAGIWTWSRGGGWGGPFVANEFWSRLNAQVLAAWAQNRSLSEEETFRQIAERNLRLTFDDATKLHEMCLLTAKAVLRGKLATRDLISPWWSRDDSINTPTLPTDALARARILNEKKEAVEMWEEIVRMADEIHFADHNTATFVRQSSRYGLYLYEIYRAIFELSALNGDHDTGALDRWLAAYDAAWVSLRGLCARADAPATPYIEKGSAYYATGEGVDIFISRLRRRARRGLDQEKAIAPNARR